MACGGGSALMRDAAYLTNIVRTISESIQSPFSIKVRSGLRDDDKNKWFDTLVCLAPYCHLITIHGRTFKQ
jgi:tRNA-dihydrouridine synthase